MGSSVGHRLRDESYGGGGDLLLEGKGKGRVCSMWGGIGKGVNRNAPPELPREGGGSVDTRDGGGGGSPSPIPDGTFRVPYALAMAILYNKS